MYSFISHGIDSAQSAAQVVIMVVVVVVAAVVVVDTNPLLLVLLHRNFIVSASLERPSYFFSVRLAHPSQGSVLGGVQFNNPNGIKTSVQNRNCTGSCRCAARPCPGRNRDRDCLSSLQLLPRPRPFSYLVMGSVTCVHFVPEATERLVQQKKLWLENPRPSDNQRGASMRLKLTNQVRPWDNDKPLQTNKLLE